MNNIAGEGLVRILNIMLHLVLVFPDLDNDVLHFRLFHHFEPIVVFCLSCEVRISAYKQPFHTNRLTPITINFVYFRNNHSCVLGPVPSRVGLKRTIRGGDGKRGESNVHYRSG